MSRTAAERPATSAAKMAHQMSTTSAPTQQWPIMRSRSSYSSATKPAIANTAENAPNDMTKTYAPTGARLLGQSDSLYLIARGGGEGASARASRTAGTRGV